jgi:Domain of unknown function (DUF4145)
MIYSLKDKQASAQGVGVRVSLRCPACRQIGTFESTVPDMRDLVLQSVPTLYFGQRSCPNHACRAHIFFVYDLQKQEVVVSYPPERIDFDTTVIPKPIVAALEEAIICHANQCFVAAAIMVRKTLEELCFDREATGHNLKDRIKALGKTVILPAELMIGLDDLRLLGNDAAHIESKEYAKVDQEEVEIAVEFTKEVLKSVYQFSALLDRLKSLKRNP